MATFDFTSAGYVYQNGFWYDRTGMPVVQSFVVVAGGQYMGDTVTADFLLGGTGTVIFMKVAPNGTSTDIGTAVATPATYRIRDVDYGYKIAARAVTFTPPTTAGTGPIIPTNYMQQKLATLNWKSATTAEALGNGTLETAGRQYYLTCSDRGYNAQLLLPSFANGNAGDVPCAAWTGYVLLEYNGKSIYLTRNGSPLISVGYGELNAKTDPINWKLWGIVDGLTPANADIYIRYRMIRQNVTDNVALGQVIAQNTGNICYTYDPSKVLTQSSLEGTGLFSMTASGNLYTRLLGPGFMLVHTPVDPTTYQALLLYGASQADGGTDLSATSGPITSGRGFLRACVGPSKNVAGGCVATAGNALGSMTGINNMTHSYVQYFTIGLIDLGGNDIGALNGTTDRNKYFTVEAGLKALLVIFRSNSPGIKLGYLIKPPCITASSDAFATLAGQTIGTEWGISNGSSGTTTGRGELYRQWCREQVRGLPDGTFTASISNFSMPVSNVDSAKRRPALGDVINATGYTGTIISINADADQDGNGSYSASPAVPAGLTSRGFTCNIGFGLGVDFVYQVPTTPGRDDLWPIASSTGWGLPGDAAIGPPAPNGSGGNHLADNHYISTCKQNLRPNVLGIVD